VNIVVVWANEWPRDLAHHLHDLGLYEHIRWLDTTGPEGYWDVLRRLWEDQRTFVVLEADKFPDAGALQELWQCPHEWCSYPVPTREGSPRAPYPSLACTKFDRTLMVSDPDLMQKVGELDLGLGVREWSRLDMAVAGFCDNIAECHWHAGGRVEHRHVGN